jgi:hypothetical protein
MNDYLNCYSTFMMTNENLRNNILNHRMNFLINYYVEQNKQIENRNKLLEYYLRSYKDDYLVPNQIEKHSIIDDPEKRDDDVEDHYKYMFINPPPKPTIDYDELDKQYALKLQLEEEEKAKEKEKNDIYYEYSDEYDDYEYDLDNDINDVDYEYDCYDTDF